MRTVVIANHNKELRFNKEQRAFVRGNILRKTSIIEGTSRWKNKNNKKPFSSIWEMHYHTCNLK